MFALFIDPMFSILRGHTEGQNHFVKNIFNPILSNKMCLLLKKRIFYIIVIVLNFKYIKRDSKNYSTLYSISLILSFLDE